MKSVTIEGMEYNTTYAPLWYHLQGLMQTSTGYGRKLNTGYKVAYKGKMRRIYACQISNAGTAYIVIKGQWVVCS